MVTAPQGKETEGSSAAWQGQRQNQGSAGRGRLSREGSQLRSGRVGIWTKPHRRFNMMPLTYFPVGKHRGDAHSAHMAPERDTSLLSPRALSRFPIPFQRPLVCAPALPKPCCSYSSTALPLTSTVNVTNCNCGIHVHSPFSCFCRAFLGLLDQR